jgi:hypothetical protein
MDTAVLATLLYDNDNLLFISASQQAGTSQNGAFIWHQGVLTPGHPTIDSATALNQIIGLSPLAADGPVSGTVVLQTLSPGTFVVGFDLTTADYFGATPGAPVTFSILAPEPTTGALLAAGLLGLATRRGPQRNT